MRAGLGTARVLTRQCRTVGNPETDCLPLGRVNLRVARHSPRILNCGGRAHPRSFSGYSRSKTTVIFGALASQQLSSFGLITASGTLRASTWRRLLDHRLRVHLASPPRARAVVWHLLFPQNMGLSVSANSRMALSWSSVGSKSSWVSHTHNPRPWFLLCFHPLSDECCEPFR